MEYLRSSRCAARSVAGSTAGTVAAMEAGRLRWLAQLKLEGKPIPCRRKKGGRNAALDEREHAAYVLECERKYREVVRRGRASGRCVVQSSVRNARIPAAGLRSTPDAKREWTLVCGIGPRKNGKDFSRASLRS
jgi:hypothetical protein